jgi:hypothetical protein
MEGESKGYNIFRWPTARTFDGGHTVAESGDSNSAVGGKIREEGK